MTNNLSAAETERLYLLIEECSEVAQEACKTLRFGYKACHPHEQSKGSNRTRLTKEMAHLYLLIDWFRELQDIEGGQFYLEMNEKTLTIADYLHKQSARDLRKLWENNDTARI